MKIQHLWSSDERSLLHSHQVTINQVVNVEKNYPFFFPQVAVTT